MRTVCLPPPRQDLQPGVTCEIAGYGKEKQGEKKIVFADHVRGHNVPL